MSTSVRHLAAAFIFASVMASAVVPAVTADDEPQPTPTPVIVSEESNSYRDQGETEGSCNCGGTSMTTNNFSANELYVP